jgi:hypothetical protein
MQANHVAGAVEAVGGEGPAIVLLRFIVAANGIGTARDQLANRAWRHLFAVVIDDSDLVSGRHRPSLRLADDLPGIVRPREVGQAFGHAEGVAGDGEVPRRPRAIDQFR